MLLYVKIFLCLKGVLKSGINRLTIMALIKCPECGKEILDKASSCPGCRHLINKAEVETEQDKYKWK